MYPPYVVTPYEVINVFVQTNKTNIKISHAEKQFSVNMKFVRVHSEKLRSIPFIPWLIGSCTHPGESEYL